VIFTAVGVAFITVSSSLVIVVVASFTRVPFIIVIASFSLDLHFPS